MPARVAARIEATPKGLDIRYVVTNLVGGNAEWLYETLYCARGQRDRPVIGGIMLRAIRSVGNVADWGVADGMDAAFNRDGD
jgi:hypothetical protein